MKDRIEQRFGWIEACLRWAGRFGAVEKAGYQKVFGLTVSMVSRDQDAYLRRVAESDAPQPVEIKKGKLELTGEGSLPALFPLPDATRWLAEVLRSKFERVPAIHRAEPPADVLQALVQALPAEQPIWFQYQPRRAPAARRTVSPHVIVHVAGRLHLRGWDHDRNAPRDFVLTRMREVCPAPNVTFIGADHDRDWSEFVRLEVVAREGEDPEALKPDFNLDAERQNPPRVRRANMRYLTDDGDSETAGAFRSPVIVRERM